MPALEDTRSAVLAAPNKPRVLNDHVGALEASGVSGSELDAALIDLQDSHKRVLPSVLLYLLRGPGAAENRHRVQPHLDRFLAGPRAGALRTVWEAFCALEPLPEDEAQKVARMPPATVQLFFMASPPTVRSLHDVVSGAVDLPAPVAAHVRDAARRLLADPADLLEGIELPSARIRDHVLERYRHISWQDRALQDRCLTLVDPWTGRTVRPFDTVVTFGRSLYSFGDARLSVLVTGDAGNQVLGLLIPGANLMVDLGSTAPKYINDLNTVNSLAVLLQRAAQHPGAYAAALAADRTPRPAETVTALWGTMQNYAHNVWNYFSAFERLVRRGLVGQVDELYFTGTEFFGPVVDILPELGRLTLVRDEHTGVRDPHPFSPDHLVVQPGSYLVLRDATERISQALSDASLPPTAADPPAAPRPFPIVWIGLRVGSRVWVDQEEEVPALVRRLHEVYPDLVVVLDGFSFPVGTDTASTKWDAAIEELHAIAETIRSRCPVPDAVVNLVRTTLREAVMWAHVTDVYLAPMGTAQHKVGWFGDATGAIYTAPSVAEVEPELRIGAWEAEGRPVPRYIFGRSETAGERRGAFDVRIHLDNIRLDLDEVTEVMLDLLGSRVRTA